MWHSFVNNTMHLTMVVMILENNIGFGKAKFEFLGFFLMLPISFFWGNLDGILVLWTRLVAVLFIPTLFA